jgi:hypothetical protein
VQGGEICGTCDMHGENKNAHRGLVGRREGREPLGRPIGSRWNWSEEWVI